MILYNMASMYSFITKSYSVSQLWNNHSKIIVDTNIIPYHTRIRGGCSSEVLQLLVHPSAASIWSCEIAYFLLIELNGCHAAGVDTLVTCGSRGCLIDIGQSPPDLHFNPAIDGRKQQNYLITKFIFQFIKVFGLLSIPVLFSFLRLFVLIFYFLLICFRK